MPAPTTLRDRLATLAKALLPAAAVRWLMRRVEARQAREYAGLASAEVFERIYARGDWGRSEEPGERFFSGLGSRTPAIVEPYVRAVRAWLESLDHRPDVVDLGCGDFHVGARIRDLCARYTACDIVAPLIEHNRRRFADHDVDFRVVDLARGALPEGEVVFIRQVLQHLANADIAAALPRIRSLYRFVVLTEHLPAGTFHPNRDKPAGPMIRLHHGSGVVLTAAPFDLPVREERVLCEVEAAGGVIRTVLYTL